MEFPLLVWLSESTSIGRMEGVQAKNPTERTSMSFTKKVTTARLSYEGKELGLPVLEGDMGERGLDIRALRQETGLVTFDPGMVNTGVCESNITFVDGAKGILRYRGYDIEDLAEHCSFLEVAYLLVHGFLPTPSEYNAFSHLMNQHSMLHENMRHFFSLYPDHAHPMAILSSMVVSLSTFYPELEADSTEAIDITVSRLLSKLRTIAAFSYKKYKGDPIVYPRPDLRYCENFLNMMFHTPVNNYVPDPVVTRALNQLLILHADHEQNCSTSVVRAVGSSRANLYASISAGICALWGPLHGGANQRVLEILEEAMHSGISPRMLVEKAKDRNNNFRLFGFGHRVYKTYDPRAKVAKRICMQVIGHLSRHDPLLDFAQELESVALADSFFQERHLYPNVDFFTGLAYRAMGIPVNMFTVMFALGRLPGWIAQWLEQRDGEGGRIVRPRQIYVGPVHRTVAEALASKPYLRPGKP